MAVLHEFTMYCCVCGGPIEEYEYGPIEWLWQVVLLHMETKLPDFTIRELTAKNCRGPYHKLLETGEAITACDVVLFQKSTPLYIPCHTKCVYLAKRVFATSDVGIEDGMKHLWRVLEARFQEASGDSIQPVTNIHSGLEHSNIGRFQGLEWEPDRERDEPEETFQSDHFVADPEEIPGMTEKILCNLQTMPIGDHTFVPSAQAQLPPIHELGLECEFKVVPSAWREALTQGYLPWLWDLDKDAITFKEATKPEDHQWNWELLVRHLAQVEIHKPRAVLDDLPMGFRNRRRIWRLVDDIIAEKAVGEEEPPSSTGWMSSQL